MNHVTKFEVCIWKNVEDPMFTHFPRPFQAAIFDSEKKYENYIIFLVCALIMLQNLKDVEVTIF